MEMNESYEPIDRRPINSRNTRWAEKVTDFLIRLKMTPNAISVFGMVAAIAAGFVFGFTRLADQPLPVWGRGLWLLGGLLCQVRLLCNLFDGMVAVKSGIASAKGELYNEVPDRISDAAIFIGLGYSAGGDTTLGFSAALVAVFVAYVRAAAKSTGAPNDFCGPMAKPHRMALVTVLTVYLTVSPSSWKLPWNEQNIVMWIVVIGGLLTAVRRLIRAAKFLEGNNR